MASPEALQIGRIVWAEVADQNGIRKQRPPIIKTTRRTVLVGSSRAE